MYNESRGNSGPAREGDQSHSPLQTLKKVLHEPEKDDPRAANSGALAHKRAVSHRHAPKFNLAVGATFPQRIGGRQQSAKSVLRIRLPGADECSDYYTQLITNC